AMLLTGGILVRENAHIRVDLVLRVLTPRWLSAVEIFNCTVGVVFCTAMAWFGYEVVQFAIEFGERSETSLQIPMAFYFSCLPVAMALMALRYVIRLFQMIRDFGAPTPIDEFHHLPSAD
ncbi:TRAP transporter small permease, partial [Roseibium sp.]|uniref:TRAP transporter small permease n=1 Tax=Roseibium sp. TaxID=1936156 RepID=UPI00329911FB